MSEKSCITINCGCCGGGSGNKEDGAPVGTVISYMGTKAPEHYLVCDGAIINIADYAYLAEQIKDEFGAVDYFGGDGTSTFAVPDLRNEFLRGYHGDALAQLSDEIGKHQAGTEIPRIVVYSYDSGKDPLIAAYIEKNSTSSIQHSLPVDTLKSDDTNIKNILELTWLPDSTCRVTWAADPMTTKGMSRPTNVAVLYCIKYE